MQKAPITTAFLFLIGILFLPKIQVMAQTDAATIIQRSVQANNRGWEADPEFAYTEQDLGAKGIRKSYDVTNVLGSPYERLIAINGKPLSESQNAEQQRKYDEMSSQRSLNLPKSAPNALPNFKLIGVGTTHF